MTRERRGERQWSAYDQHKYDQHNKRGGEISFYIASPIHIHIGSCQPGQQTCCHHSNVNIFSSTITLTRFKRRFHEQFCSLLFDVQCMCYLMLAETLKKWKGWENSLQLSRKTLAAHCLWALGTLSHQDSLHSHPPHERQSIWGWDRCVMGRGATGCEFCREGRGREGRNHFSVMCSASCKTM